MRINLMTGAALVLGTILTGFLLGGASSAPAAEGGNVALEIHEVDNDIIEVIVFGSQKFDPKAEVRPRKVRFGPAGARPFLIFPKRRHGFDFDVDKDGHGDQAFWFKRKKTGIAEDLLIACLEGQLRGEGRVEACGLVGTGEISSPCKLVQNATTEPLSVQCIFEESRYPLSLGGLIDTINEDIASLGLSVTDATPLWLEARGGDGAQGKKHSAKGGAGGGGGYARTALQTGELVNGILADGDSLYILIGDKGRTGNGGSGGAATIVIGQDLEKVLSDARDPGVERVLMIGAGGGGGGAGETGLFGTAKGKAGGNGGVAEGSLLSAHSVEGGKGKGGDNSGEGGNGDEAGGGGSGHRNGKAGIGGLGGANGGKQAGWGIAELDSWEAGRGGDSSDGVGGSGGGGFGGGGGGKACKALSCGNGAGAGGSWARRATFENEVGAFLGPESMPENDGKGTVVLTFRLD